jgi:hypothetical protein
VVQTLLDIGRAMIESDRCVIAAQVLEGAVQHCRTLRDPIAMKEAQNLLAAARRGGKPALDNAVSRPPVAGQQTPPATNEPAAQTQPVPAAPPAPPAPNVSIIIPTFNKIELTRRCLLALLANTPGPRHEIVVVDNGSTDGTPEFLRAEESAGRLRAILNGENTGFSKACNQGAQAATGRHILFLNNDTQVEAGWLEPLVETMEADQNVVAVGGKLLFPDRTIQHAGVVILEDRQLPDPLVARHIHYRKPESDPGASHACTYQALTAACLLIRKSVFEKTWICASNFSRRADCSFINRVAW